MLNFFAPSHPASGPTADEVADVGADVEPIAAVDEAQHHRTLSIPRVIDSPHITIFGGKPFES